VTLCWDAEWIDTTWGGDNTDKCILAPSKLTVLEEPPSGLTWSGPADWATPGGVEWTS
jgi:hypothetical protein